VKSSYKKSDHYDGKKFFNQGPFKDKTLVDIMKWQMTADRKKWPKWVENSAQAKLGFAASPNEVNTTFINHATYLMQFQKTNVIVDPVFSKRASPVKFAGPKRVRRPGVELKDLPPIHVVLVTHNHYDHMDIDSLKWLDKKFNPLVLTPLGNKKTMAVAGIRNIHELDWWESFKTDELEITLTPAQHWSARGLNDKREALWGGFFIRAEKLTVFWAGDTGYGQHFKQIQEKLGSPDLSFQPVGAYEPRWFMKDMHANPSDAMQAHFDLKTKMSVGMHFGTFQLTDEGIEDPVLELEKVKKEKGVENFVVLKEGESRRFKFP
jgi:L-ascorbate metabolism protein UlaG (beta-lactamase superfamily)